MDSKKKGEILEEIYDKFTDEIITNGWKGKLFDWEETASFRKDGNPCSSSFRYGNGFCLVVCNYATSDKNTHLRYWFESDDDRSDEVYVDDLEQLLKLLK